MCEYCEPDRAGNLAWLRDEPDRSASLEDVAAVLYEREAKLEAIVWEMLDCISNGQDTWGYTRYFMEKIEALGITIPTKGD